MRKFRPPFTVYWIGGSRDGETIAEFESEYDAEKFAAEYYDEHEDEFDPVCGGVSVMDSDGDLVW